MQGPRPPLHPVLRALLRVMSAPGSALREGLGGYAVTFVRWHLWGVIRRGLVPRGERVLDPGPLCAKAGHPGFGRLSQLLKPQPEGGSRRTLWDYEISPEGVVHSLFGSGGGKGSELYSVWGGNEVVRHVRRVYTMERTTPDGHQEISLVTGLLGFAVAWNVRRMYAMRGASCATQILAVELDRKGPARCLLDWTGPQLPGGGRVEAGRIGWYTAPTDMACSPGGQQVYLMGDGFLGCTWVAAIDTKQGQVEREWIVPGADSMAVTAEGHLVFMSLPWRFSPASKLAFAVYSPEGMALHAWAEAVALGPDAHFVNHGLFYDPQARLLVAAFEVQMAPRVPTVNGYILAFR